MSRYKITIEYKGSNYAGWQIQKNGITIQETIQDACKKVFHEDITITGSGRTDAGVHALGQVAHFNTNSKIPESKIPYAINTFLPDDIRIINCEKVDDNFHARYNAKSKTYQYKMYYGTYLSPLRKDTYYWLTKKPDINLMRLGAQLFIGEHDFKFFKASGSNVKNTIRTIYSIKIEEIDNEIIITVCGNGFLYNMVRILSGTLLYIGLGKLTIMDMYGIMDRGDRRRAGKTLPANGLCLVKVEY